MNRHILFTESSPNVGGQELQLMQQMQALQQAGFSCTLACRPGGAVWRQARDLGLETEGIAFRNSMHLPSILRLRALLNRTSASMLICHSGHDTNNAAVAARLARLRPFVLRSRTYLAGKCSAFSYRCLVDATMMPSRFLKDQLLRSAAICPEQVHVVYPGIDFAEIDRRAQDELPEPVASWLARGEGPVLLQVAMLRGEKGHLTILAALDALRATRPDLRYLIAGDGEGRLAIERKIAELGLGERVFLAGKVVPAYMLYRHADLLVMPSLYEPLGMAQIEALAVSLPVIASDTGGIPETVTNGVSGLLVEPGNVDAWRKAIDLALSTPDLMRRMATAGCEDVRRRFSIEANLRSILALRAGYQRS